MRLITRFGWMFAAVWASGAAWSADSVIIHFDDGGEARLMSFDGTVVVSEELRDGELWRYRSYYGAVDLTIDGPGLRVRPVDGSPSPLLLTPGAGGRFELARLGTASEERLVQTVTVGGIEAVRLSMGVVCARIVDVRVTWEGGGFAQRRFWIAPTLGYYVKVLGAEFLPSRPVVGIETIATSVDGADLPIVPDETACPTD